jgi:hypothetical protein
MLGERLPGTQIDIYTRTASKCTVHILMMYFVCKSETNGHMIVACELLYAAVELRYFIIKQLGSGGSSLYLYLVSSCFIFHLGHQDTF